MFGTLAFAFAAATLATLARGAQTITAQYDCLTAGDYQLCNNHWGAADGTGSQSATLISNSGGSISWSTTYTWANNPNNVKTYTNVGSASAKGMQLSAITSAPSTWDWQYVSQSSGLRADVSYDIWVGTTPDGAQASSASSYEIMIWLSSAGGVSPIGSKTSSVTLAGHNWDVWTGPNANWQVISFLSADGDVTSFNADLNDFFKYIAQNNGVDSSLFLQGIETGTEPFTGSAELLTNSYSVSVSTSSSSSNAQASATTAPATLASSSAASASASSASPAAQSTAGATTLTTQYDCVTAGEYQLCNNQWGITSGSGSQTATLIGNVGNNISWSTAYDWANSPNSVKTYTNVESTTAKGMLLSAITSAPSSWDWQYVSQSNGLRADVSYDIWVGNTANGAQASSASSYEIMIWLSGLGGVNPVGSKSSSVVLAGHSWDVWTGPNANWQVISFVSADGDITSFNADLNDFFKYIVQNNGVDSSLFLQGIETGTEPFTGSAELLTNSYSVSVSTGASSQNTQAQASSQNSTCTLSSSKKKRTVKRHESHKRRHFGQRH